MVGLDSCFHVGQVTGHNVDGPHQRSESFASFVSEEQTGGEFDEVDPKGERFPIWARGEKPGTVIFISPTLAGCLLA